MEYTMVAERPEDIIFECVYTLMLGFRVVHPMRVWIQYRADEGNLLLYHGMESQYEGSI